MHITKLYSSDRRPTVSTSTKCFRRCFRRCFDTIVLENETDPVFRLFPIVMFPIVIPVINIILLQHSVRGREPCAQPHDTQPRRSSLSLSGVHPSSTPGPPPSHVSRRNYTRSEIRIIVHRCRHASLARGSSYRVEERERR